MNEAEDFSKKAIPLASSLLRVPSPELEVENITRTFPWMKKHQIYWALTSADRRSVIMVFNRNGSPFITSSPSGAALLSLVVTDETGPLPHGLSPVQLAEAFRQLTVSPQGLVGSPEMFGPSSPSRDAWIRSTGVPPQQQAALLKENSAAPVLHVNPQTKGWTLDFSYFNEQGGIEGWHLAGDEKQILATTQKMRAANDTLNWPFE